MLRKIILLVRKYILNIDDRSQLEIAIANGLKIGQNCNVMGECIIDPGHCFLIEIGNKVTLAPRVHLLAHDASTKRELHYTVIRKIVIGNNVFIGAGSIILPGVKIGNNVIIGAGSVVSHDITENSVAVGNPARIIETYQEYMKKRKIQMHNSRVFDESYTIENITEGKKKDMKDYLSDKNIGFII